MGKKKKIELWQLENEIMNLELEQFQAVFPVTKNGQLACEIIARVHGVPIASMDALEAFDSGEVKVLLVDDMSNTGATLEKAKSHFKKAEVKTFLIAGKADYCIFNESSCIEIELPMSKTMNSRFQKYWFFLVGFLATVWVLLRSGLNPKRLVYPCQRAALPLATLWLATVGAFFANTLLVKFIKRKKVKVAAVSVLSLGTVLFLFGFVYSTVPDVNLPTELSEAVTKVNLPKWEVNQPISKLFVVENFPKTSGSVAAGNKSVPDENLEDPAMNSLIEKMTANGLDFYRTAEAPKGLIAQDSVVVVKCNFQWEDRSGTNNDRIKGLIQNILKFPQGFKGEILIVDNTQDIENLAIDGFDNNSDYKNQSVVNVVDTFKAKGYPVSLMNFGYLNGSEVKEYSEGDATDGYVYSENENKITYPKFKTPEGNAVSLRYGVWSDQTQTYDRSKLTIINMPILKAHIVAGVTAGIKNWVGVFCINYEKVEERYGGFGSLHDDYFFGSKQLLPALIDKVRPDLTIIDATWVNALNHNQREGGIVPFDPAYLKHTNILVASKDPLAASWYSAKYILNPLAYFKDRTNPDLPEKDWNIEMTEFGILHPYAEILKNWEVYFKENQIPWTRDPNRISVF